MKLIAIIIGALFFVGSQPITASQEQDPLIFNPYQLIHDAQTGEDHIENFLCHAHWTSYWTSAQFDVFVKSSIRCIRDGYTSKCHQAFRHLSALFELPHESEDWSIELRRGAQQTRILEWIKLRRISLREGSADSEETKAKLNTLKLLEFVVQKRKDILHDKRKEEGLPVKRKPGRQRNHAILESVKCD